MKGGIVKIFTIVGIIKEKWEVISRFVKSRGVCVCFSVCVWPEASLLSGSPEHAGTAGQCVFDLSIWSLPGAHTALLCSVCVCVSERQNPSGFCCP